MNGYAALELQKGIMNKLKEHIKRDSVLKNILLSDKWKKEHQSFEKAQINFGESKTSLWRGPNFEGEEHEFKLYLYSGSPFASVSKQMAGRLIELLHNCELKLVDQVLLDMSFQWEATGKRDCHHYWSSELCFKALTISD